MSEPPHQVPFDAWNRQLRPDGWDDLGLVLQSDDLEGGDRHPASSFNFSATIDSDQYNNVSNGTAGDGSSISHNGYSSYSSNNITTPAIPVPDAFINYNSSAFDHQAVPSFSHVTSDFNRSTGVIEHATPSTFGYNYINTAHFCHEISDGPPLRDVNGGFASTWPSAPLVEGTTDLVASTFSHGLAPNLLHEYGSFVPTVPMAGSATILTNAYGSWDPRTSDQNTAPPLSTAYSSFTPTTNFTSLPTPSFDGYDTFDPTYNVGYPALSMQSLHVEDTIVPEDGLSSNLSPMPMVANFETDISLGGTSVASKELNRYVLPKVAFYPKLT
ncbi:MAG: hypothetical protein Q9187_004649 [Circinaria calcarea]